MARGRQLGHPRAPGRAGGADLVSLSRLLLEARGLRVLGYALTADGTRLDLVARGGGRLVAAAVTATPGARFAAVLGLLESAAAARLARQGTRFEVHSWARRAGGRVCDVVRIGREDFSS